MEQTVITSSTVVNSVVEKLRAALARGQWRSGDMLPGQRELAEHFGVDRRTIRRNHKEAIMPRRTALTISVVTLAVRESGLLADPAAAVHRAQL